MKQTQFLRKLLMAFLVMMLSLSLCLAVACGTPANTSEPTSEQPSEQPSESTTPGESEQPSDNGPQLYTVTFMDGETVIYQTEAATGEMVDIPEDLTTNDERLTFMGWEGLDDADYEAGQVEVFSADLTYSAKWYTMFGSNTEFNAMQVRFTQDITIDGQEDSAWADATAYNLNDTESTVKFMWTESAVYIFANIVDVDATGDNLEVKIDLLHSEDLASESWNGIDWGGSYRGEPGPMVEGGYVINAGSDTVNNWYWEWLSQGNQADTYVKSVVTAGTGYTVEMKIGTVNGNIPAEYRPHVDQVIGLAVRNLNDRTVTLENFDKYMDQGPKSLSNVRFVANENNNKDVINVVEVRENFAVTVDNKEDLLYKDANVATFGDSTVKTLWTEGVLYMFANIAEGATLKLESPILEEAVTLNATTELYLEATENNPIAKGEIYDFTITYNDGENNTITEVYVKCVENPNNIGRKMYTAHKLATDATITVDGAKDAAYGEEASIIINTVSLVNEEGNTDNTGKAWIRWDNDNLYVYVEVIDADVTTTKEGDPWDNDSVELWLSTCQSLPTAGTGWGDANRPIGNTAWCGEGGWRVVALSAELSGQHWMYDWADGVPRQIVSAPLMDEEENQIGYTVEYKIYWASFQGVEDKVGQVVDIMIDINDDDGQDHHRDSIISMNKYGSNAWDRPYVLEQLKLVA